MSNILYIIYLTGVCVCVCFLIHLMKTFYVENSDHLYFLVISILRFYRLDNFTL
jgi:hypothetical protein